MVYIENWDSGQPGAFWDVGLQWDVNSFPVTGNVQPYLNLVTSEHNVQPDYMAMLAATLQPFADIQNLLASMPGLYDLDAAVGSQLDTDGLWIGVTRNLAIPLTGVFFSWNVAGLGWGQGNWSPGINTDELIELPDAQYRTLLYATIAKNNWDGTVAGAYAIWDIVFAGTGYGLLIQDKDTMHVDFALTGPVPDAVTLALFLSGELMPISAGVEVDHYYTPVVPDVPYFGFGVENDNIAGWGVGYWGVKNAPA